MQLKRAPAAEKVATETAAPAATETAAPAEDTVTPATEE
jgi:small subunit ribosomal protein S2